MHEIIFYKNKKGEEPVLEYMQELSEMISRKGAVGMSQNSSVGCTWAEVRQEMFTKEEIAESDLRVALIGEIVKARKEKGISQRKLGEMSGVKQPIIARMENGTASPNLSTVLKVLASLGKTLYIGDL